MNRSKKNASIIKIRYKTFTYFSDTQTPRKYDYYYSRQAKFPAAVATKFYTVTPIILGTRKGECFMSPFNRLQFWGGSHISGKFVNPWIILILCVFPYGLEHKLQMNILEYIFNSQLKSLHN
jgi:hypothetical protein